MWDWSGAGRMPALRHAESRAELRRLHRQNQEPAGCRRYDMKPGADPEGKTTATSAGRGDRG